MPRKQATVASRIDKILAAKKSAETADTSGLERQIDALVYGLYGLSEEEIKAIEGEKCPRIDTNGESPRIDANFHEWKMSTN